MYKSKVAGYKLESTPASSRDSSDRRAMHVVWAPRGELRMSAKECVNDRLCKAPMASKWLSK